MSAARRWSPERSPANNKHIRSRLRSPDSCRRQTFTDHLDRPRNRRSLSRSPERRQRTDNDLSSSFYRRSRTRKSNSQSLSPRNGENCGVPSVSHSDRYSKTATCKDRHVSVDRPRHRRSRSPESRQPHTGEDYICRRSISSVERSTSLSLILRHRENCHKHTSEVSKILLLKQQVARLEKSSTDVIKELQACWDGAEHLRHIVEIQEVLLTQLLVQLQVISGDDVDLLTRQVQTLASKLITCKRAIGL